MVEVKLGPKTVDAPYTVRIPNISEQRFDEWVDEDTKAELLDGVMIAHSPVSPRHDNVASFLRTLMRCYASKKRLGLVSGPDTLIRLASGRKVCPDIFFIEQARVPHPLPRQQFQGPVDLVVEVLLPSNRDEDLENKRPAYHEAGVRELWFIDLETQEVLVERRREKNYSATRIGSGESTRRSCLASGSKPTGCGPRNPRKNWSA